MLRLSVAYLPAKVLLLLFLSIASTAVSAEAFEILVEPDWLNQRLGQKNLVILDARSPAMFAKGHIEGAVNLPVSSTYNPNPPKTRLAPENHISQLFGDAGIGDDSVVVVYDDGIFKDAARVTWSLWVYGHSKAAMLSINYAGWKNQNRPTSLITTKPEAKKFTSRLQPEHLVTQLHTQLAIQDSETILVDVRSAEEYRGEKSESRRYGHIPTAMSYDWHLMAVHENQAIRLKTRAELQALFADIPRGTKVIAYCNKGKEAALGNFALNLLGYDVSLYDGGWYEWGNSLDLPVEGPDQAPLQSLNPTND